MAKTRTGILSAAQDHDYEALRPLIKLDGFLSDYGFGRSQPDPVQQWQKLGDRPLETMDVLLHLPRKVRKTNEGTLYEWPRFSANSKPGEMTAEERNLLRRIMSEAEVRNAILPEQGYTAPRLGILADGTWWFFILESGP